MAKTPLEIVILGFDGVQSLDIAGPLDAFDSANMLRPESYVTRVCSLDGAAFTAHSGLTMQPECAFDQIEAIDSLILPGGAGLRLPGVAPAIAAAIRARAPKIRRVVSVCTGIYGMAVTGLLDGRRATTHWAFAPDVVQRFPKVRLEPDAIYVKDGPYYSSAGVTAAIDLALVLIEEDYGAKLAMDCARDLVVYLRRSGGQKQYAEPLRFQARAGEPFSALAQWMASNLACDLSVQALADRVFLSPRQFNREFKRIFGVGPATQVENLRLDAARLLLTSTSLPIEQVAARVGYRSVDAFRRAYDRHFGLTPTDYRHRFTPSDNFNKGEIKDASLSG